MSIYIDEFEKIYSTKSNFDGLRAKILQLAIEGKLVPQDPLDEPASVLLEKIKIEKKQLIKDNIIRKPIESAVVSQDEIPFEIPESWKWVRLGDVSNYGEGKTITPENISNDEWVLELEDIEKNTGIILSYILNETRQSKSNKNRFHEGDVLYGKLRPYLKKILVAEESGVCTTEIVAFRGYGNICSKYIALVMKSPYIDNYINSITHGMNMPRLGTDNARAVLFPLPPINEQYKIALRTNVLMSIIDDVEEKVKKSEILQKQLPQAVVDAIGACETEHQLKEQLEFVIENFEEIFQKAESMQDLRNVILQLAIEGKLVPQDPSDGPSSVLLEKIKAEREQLIKDKKIKKPAVLGPISEDEIPFEIPKSWEWVRLGNVISITSGDGLTSKNMATDGKFEVYGGNGITGYHNECNIFESTIVIGRVGYYCGSVHLTPERAWVTDNAFITSFPTKTVNREWLIQTLKTMDLGKNDNSTAQPVISQGKIYPYLMPMPPFEEQNRIVKKTETLMLIVDQMEEKLKRRDQIIEQLGSA